MIRTDLVAFLMAAMMLAASIGAEVIRSSGKKVASQESGFLLETMIPTQFGDWREETDRIVQVINPQGQELANEIYSQVLSRSYVNHDGYRIMLSLAYGSDQRGPLRAHDPEGCYPAQGFALHRREEARLSTDFGDIPVRRLFTSNGARVEPVTYWFRLGDVAVIGWQRRFVELGYTLTGKVPDGLLFRISSIDLDQSRAYQLHDQFAQQLLESLSAPERKHLTGLGAS